MGWLDKLKAALTPKKKRPDSQFSVTRWDLVPPRPGAEALAVAYAENPVLRPAEKIADAVAGVCWRVFHLVDDQNKPSKMLAKSYLRAAPRHRWKLAKEAVRKKRMAEQEDHVLVQLLASPNDFQDGFEFQKLADLYYTLIGEVFIAVQRVGKFPVALWLIPPFAVRALPRLSDPADKRVYFVTFGRLSGTIAADDMIHIRNPDPRDPLGRGTGVGFALGDELETAEYAARFIKAFLYNFGVPAAVLGVEGADPSQLMTNPQVKAWIESINREHKGPENAGKTMLLPGKVTLQKMGNTFEEMELQKAREFEERFTRRTMGVPPEIMGDTATSNVASARAAKQIFAEDVVTPHMEVFRRAYQHKLMPQLDPNGVLEFDSPIPADREHELKVAVAAPWSRAVNEWRELQGLEPDPQFEGVYPPLAMPGQQMNEPAEKPDEEPEDSEDPEIEVDGKPEAEPEVNGKHVDPVWAKQLRNGVRRDR